MNSYEEEEEERIGFRINNWDLNNEFNSNKTPKKKRNDKNSQIYGKI